MATVRKEPFANRSSPTTLPGDIIFYQIFPRLPVKSIHRFRCVSTSCRHLTSDRNFLSAVRRYAPRRYFLSFSTAMHWQLALYSLDPSGSASSIPIGDNPRNLDDHCTYAKLIDGLMLTVQGSYKAPVVSVSNTATNEKFQLPPSPEPSRQDMMFFYFFCHDPDTDKYKVVRTTAVGTYVGENDTVIYSVLTLGPHMSWRDYSLPNLYQTGKSKSVCINGTLYCTRFSRTNGDRSDTSVIGALTVKRERFYAVKYPKGLSPSRYNHCHLIELNGALAVIDVQDFKGREMKLWIKEKGKFKFGEESWMECRIEFDPRWEATYGLLLSYSFSTNLDGEIVMGSTRLRSGHGCWIFVYNMESREWRRVEVEGLGDRVILGNFGVDEYVETPLLLRQMLNPASHQVRSTAVIGSHQS